MNKHVVFWFSLSLTFAVICGISALQQAFNSEYVVQDDARVYVFWMQRFADPDLLPRDLIADYYKSLTPSGYALLFQVVAKLGIEPLLFSKLLPPVMGVVTTAYAFGVCLQILPVPAAAFMGTLLMNQSIWLKGDLASATPRGFLYPLFLAFLYYLLRKSLLGVVVAIALLGLFYAPFMFLCIVILILRLWRWDRKLPRLSENRRDYLFCAVGLGVAGVVFLPYLLSFSEFGPTVTAIEARTWPEFTLQGRVPFFDDNFFRFWLQGNHSSIRLSINPPLVGASLLLPFLLRYPSRFRLAKQVSQNVTILTQISIASFSLFFAAHLLLFKLYLPSRYTQHTLRIAIAIAAGIALAIVLDAVQASGKSKLLAWGATLLVWANLLFYPSLFWKDFPWTGYIVGGEPKLYEFFQQQPKDILIASLAEETNNLPTFSQRSVLVARKYTDPFLVRYTLEVRQRASDLIRAQYSPSLEEVTRFIQKYGVDFWLVEKTAFTPSYLDNRWLKQFQPAQLSSRANLEKLLTPALAKVMNSCSVFDTGGFVVLQAKCIEKTANASANMTENKIGAEQPDSFVDRKKANIHISSNRINPWG